jgi:predicted MFS family arabinose efflux permease
MTTWARTTIVSNMGDTAQVNTDLLGSRRYALFWISSFFSNMGTWMQQVAQPWIILSLSASSLWIGFDSFALNAPGWLFTLWGGLLADRFDRKKIILIFQSVQALCILFLLAFLIAGRLKIWMIIVTSFLIGTTDAFSVPALQSIIPSIVERKDIPHAIALNSTQFNLSRVAGPALAGFIIAGYGAITCVGANLVSYLPFFLSIYWIYPRRGSGHVVHLAAAASVSTPNQFFAIFRDLSFQIPLISQFVTSLLCGQVIIFSSVFIKDVFHSGAAELGWASASFGLGGVCGAIASTLLAQKLKVSQTNIVFSAVLLGVAVMFVSVAPSLRIFDFWLAAAGFGLTISSTAANSILQMGAKNSGRGKVASLLQLAIRGGLSLGALFTALLTSHLGARTSFFVDGALAVVIQSFLLCRRQKPAVCPV